MFIVVTGQLNVHQFKQEKIVANEKVMLKTTFKISKMDCPSEEQMIRMKLADLKNINSLDFDIPNRLLTVFHTDNHDQIFQRLDNLKFDTSLIDSVTADNYSVATDNTDQERKLLWQVLAINFFFFAY